MGLPLCCSRGGLAPASASGTNLFKSRKSNTQHGEVHLASGDFTDGVLDRAIVKGFGKHAPQATVLPGWKGARSRSRWHFRTHEWHAENTHHSRADIRETRTFTDHSKTFLCLRVSRFQPCGMLV